MAIEDNVNKVLAGTKDREKDADFRSLKDFYEQAKKDGIAIKQDYTLPQFDGIGRRFYAKQKAPS
ncbi:MAG: hypothetical protein WBD87_14930 [Candidatus Acidiferrales bacterium]